MNYWLQRVSHHAEISRPLLEKGILATGWSDFALEGITNLRQEPEESIRWKKFEETFDNVWGERPRNRYFLWRFLFEFAKGDQVLIPGPGEFSVYELISEYPEPVGQVPFEEMNDWNGEKIALHDGNLKRDKELIDLGFFWKVKLVHKQISRYEYADSPLTSRLKAQQTNLNISDLEQSITRAITAAQRNSPINIHSQFLEGLSPQVLELLHSELNDTKLERLVKWYLKRTGASDVFIPSKNESDKEGDADVVATFEQLKLIIYVQVKFHTGSTDSFAVEQIRQYKNNKDSLDDGYSRVSWVVSTADNFSQEASRIAQEEQILLVNGTQFSEMLLEAGFLDLKEAIK